MPSKSHNKWPRGTSVLQHFESLTIFLRLVHNIATDISYQAVSVVVSPVLRFPVPAVLRLAPPPCLIIWNGPSSGRPLIRIWRSTIWTTKSKLRLGPPIRPVVPRNYSASLAPTNSRCSNPLFTPRVQKAHGLMVLIGCLPFMMQRRPWCASFADRI